MGGVETLPVQEPGLLLTPVVLRVSSAAEAWGWWRRLFSVSCVLLAVSLTSTPGCAVCLPSCALCCGELSVSSSVACRVACRIVCNTV